MNVGIIGTGRVGGTLAFVLSSESKVNELHLINRNQQISVGVKADIVATYPEMGSKILVSDHDSGKDLDVLVVTAGSFGAPAGSSLWEVNKSIIKDIFSKLQLKDSAKVIVITTPCDRTAKLVKELSNLPSQNIIGFGGQLDVNRLKYLIYREQDNYEFDLNVNFVGEHGKRGIPVFDDNEIDKVKIVDETRNFFGKYLLEYGASTFGTANELAKLVKALLLDSEEILTISYYEEKHDLFVTWPCRINMAGVVGPIHINLNNSEKSELNELIEVRQKEEK